MKGDCTIGLIGLAVMGQNLVLNLLDHDNKVAVYNRTTQVTDDFVGEAKHDNLVGVNALGVSVLLILGTLPTASSAFILARQMGGNANLMANIITLQTLMAFLVMPAWLVLAANTALF